MNGRKVLRLDVYLYLYGVVVRSSESLLQIYLGFENILWYQSEQSEVYDFVNLDFLPDDLNVSSEQVQSVVYVWILETVMNFHNELLTLIVLNY